MTLSIYLSNYTHFINKYVILRHKCKSREEFQAFYSFAQGQQVTLALISKFIYKYSDHIPVK